jgi:Domain of unknown function (DUF4398)
MPMRLRKTAPASAAAAALLLLGACSSVPPPDDAMATAKMALQQAEATEAPREAPLVLQQARDKLTEAEKAMVAEDYVTARRLAQEAAADAHFAQAQAQRAVAQRNRQQVETTIDALAPDRSAVTATQPSAITPSTTSVTPLAPPAPGGLQ